MPKTASAKPAPKSFEFSRLEGSLVLPQRKHFQESLKELNASTRASIRSLLKAYAQMTFDPKKEVQDHMKGVSPYNAYVSHRSHRQVLEDHGFELPVGPDRIFDAYLTKTQEAPIRVVWRFDKPSREDAVVAMALVKHLNDLIESVESVPAKQRPRKNPWS